MLPGSLGPVPLPRGRPGERGQTPPALDDLRSRRLLRVSSPSARRRRPGDPGRRCVGGAWVCQLSEMQPRPTPRGSHRGLTESPNADLRADVGKTMAEKRPTPPEARGTRGPAEPDHQPVGGAPPWEAGAGTARMPPVRGDSVQRAPVGWPPWGRAQGRLSPAATARPPRQGQRLGCRGRGRAAAGSLRTAASGAAPPAHAAPEGTARGAAGGGARAHSRTRWRPSRQRRTRASPPWKPPRAPQMKRGAGDRGQAGCQPVPHVNVSPDEASPLPFSPQYLRTRLSQPSRFWKRGALPQGAAEVHGGILIAYEYSNLITVLCVIIQFPRQKRAAHCEKGDPLGSVAALGSHPPRGSRPRVCAAPHSPPRPCWRRGSPLLPARTPRVREGGRGLRDLRELELMGNSSGPGGAGGLRGACVTEPAPAAEGLGPGSAGSRG